MSWKPGDTSSPIEGDDRHANLSLDLVMDDTGERIGNVVQFYEGMPFYGTSAKGRTGPVMDLERCKARVEQMVFGTAAHEQRDSHD